jgi:hypothetical protein
MSGIRVAVLAAVLAASAPSFASAAVTEDSFKLRSTADLVDLCSASSSDPLYTAAVHFCVGFGVGVYRTLEEHQAALEHRWFCPSGEMPTRAQAMADFVTWARAAPDQMAAQPTDSILAFVIQRNPCPQEAPARTRVRGKGNTP